MIDQLKALFKLDSNEVVSYNDIAAVEAGLWYNLNSREKVVEERLLTPGVWYKRYPTKVSGQQIFITRIYKGYGYHYHSHDCKETVTPINGSIRINDSNTRVVEMGVPETFYANTKHKVDYHSSVDGVFVEVFVEFLKV